jgi:transcriptional regulator with XRE-family HTH domain
MKPDSTYIREFLTGLRKKYKIQAKDVANHIGMSRSSFSLKEKGKVVFSIDEIEAYANYLGFEIRLCLLKDS